MGLAVTEELPNKAFVGPAEDASLSYVTAYGQVVGNSLVAGPTDGNASERPNPAGWRSKPRSMKRFPRDPIQRRLAWAAENGGCDERLPTSRNLRVNAVLPEGGGRCVRCSGWSKSEGEFDAGVRDQNL